jgi:hypothetical protein
MSDETWCKLMQIACFQGNFRRFVGIETMESASPGIPSAMEIFTWFRLKKCHSMSSIDIKWYQYANGPNGSRKTFQHTLTLNHNMCILNVQSSHFMAMVINASQIPGRHAVFGLVWKFNSVFKRCAEVSTLFAWIIMKYSVIFLCFLWHNWMNCSCACRLSISTTWSHSRRKLFTLQKAR